MTGMVSNTQELANRMLTHIENAGQRDLSGEDKFRFVERLFKANDITKQIASCVRIPWIPKWLIAYIISLLKDFILELLIQAWKRYKEDQKE